jgi:hypothetical protein
MFRYLKLFWGPIKRMAIYILRGLEHSFEKHQKEENGES